MFCPNCGNGDQTPETYCRRCGTFLPDLSKPAKKREATPEENLKANSFLTLMTVIVSFSLAITLYIFLGFRDETHPLIYATAGFLIAMGAWHIQTFIRTRQLKRQWERKYRPPNLEKESKDAKQFEAAPAAQQLPDADLTDAVPMTVTEATTKNLSRKT
jgi:hypothetical protein